MQRLPLPVRVHPAALEGPKSDQRLHGGARRLEPAHAERAVEAGQQPLAVHAAPAVLLVPREAPVLGSSGRDRGGGQDLAVHARQDQRPHRVAVPIQVRLGVARELRALEHGERRALQVEVHGQSEGQAVLRRLLAVKPSSPARRARSTHGSRAACAARVEVRLQARAAHLLARVHGAAVDPRELVEARLVPVEPASMARARSSSSCSRITRMSEGERTAPTSSVRSGRGSTSRSTPRLRVRPSSKLRQRRVCRGRTTNPACSVGYRVIAAMRS